MRCLKVRVNVGIKQLFTFFKCTISLAGCEITNLCKNMRIYISAIVIYFYLLNKRLVTVSSSSCGSASLVEISLYARTNLKQKQI